MYICMYAIVRMLFVVSFISIRHFLFSVYISVCILYIVGSMFAIILCQIVTLPCGTVVSTDITSLGCGEQGLTSTYTPRQKMEIVI